jgi:CheY-like chemotaxis protein
MSESTRLFPYYFPTTVVFVDDNPKFLRSLALELPEDLAYQTFENAEAALARIERTPEVPPLYQRCFSQYAGGQGGSGEQLIHLDLSQIELEISNRERFQEVSVVVVDFDMPQMNGLELCRRITDPRIRKVLFTGVADEKIAVQAFNAGIIDRFIIKSQPDAVEAVRRAVLELQQRYFEAISETLRATLMLNPPRFLTDPAVEGLFSELREAHKLVEYYLVAKPGGFLALTDEGELFRFVVLSESELDAQANWAAAQGAPEADRRRAARAPAPRLLLRDAGRLLRERRVRLGRVSGAGPSPRRRRRLVSRPDRVAARGHRLRRRGGALQRLSGPPRHGRRLSPGDRGPAQQLSAGTSVFSSREGPASAQHAFPALLPPAATRSLISRTAAS